MAKEKDVQTLFLRRPESKPRKKRDEEGAFEVGRGEGAGKAEGGLGPPETAAGPGTTDHLTPKSTVENHSPHTSAQA